MGWVLVIDEDQDESAWIERVARTHGHRTQVFDGVYAAREALARGAGLVIVSAGKQGERAEARLRVLEREGVDAGRILLVLGGLRSDGPRNAFTGRLAGILRRPLGLDILTEHLQSAFSAPSPTTGR